MRRLGRVVRTAQGLAIVRCPDDSIPDIGDSVVDEELDSVGRVVDVFGPTDRPFVAVSPASDRRLASLLNRRVYRR